MDTETGTDATVTPRRRRTPRQRAAPAAEQGVDARLAKLRDEWLAEAQSWLATRPGRVVTLPDDLPALLLARGVPCADCLAKVWRPGDAGHEVRFARSPGQHWAAGITAHCGRPPAAE